MVNIYIVNEEETKAELENLPRNYILNQSFDYGDERSIDIDISHNVKPISGENFEDQHSNEQSVKNIDQLSYKNQLPGHYEVLDNQSNEYIDPSNFRSQISTTVNPASAKWLTPEQLEELAKENKKKRKVRKYYEQQEELVKDFKEDKELLEKFTQNEEEARKEQNLRSVKRMDDIMSKVSLVANVCVLAAQCTAAGISGSLVVMGMAVESATDITAGLVIFLTNRAIKKRDHYKYPRGRTRLQPIGLVIISVIMGACSVQVIDKSIESIVHGSVDTVVDTTIISIMVTNIVAKIILMTVCYIYRSPSCLVLAQDHRNDIISNTTALICAYLGHRYWKYLDPIAAICVSIYIIASWFKTGREHIRELSGMAADNIFISRVIKICLDHRPALKQIDTVYAYHFGMNYLVEVHVVLDENMKMREAHDIAEPLQRKIEHLPEVERAFVHIDFEAEHNPQYEHTVV